MEILCSNLDSVLVEKCFPRYPGYLGFEIMPRVYEVGTCQACRVLEQQTSRARTLPNQTKHAQSNSTDCMFTIASRFLVTPDAFLGISFLPSISLKGRTLEACGNPIRLQATESAHHSSFPKPSGTLRIGTTERTCQCRIDVNSGAHPNPKWKWEQNGFFFFWINDRRSAIKISDPCTSRLIEDSFILACWH